MPVVLVFDALCLIGTRHAYSLDAQSHQVTPTDRSPVVTKAMPSPSRTNSLSQITSLVHQAESAGQ